MKKNTKKERQKQLFHFKTCFMDTLAMKGTCTLTQSHQKFKIFKHLLIPPSCSENKRMKMSPRTTKFSISKQCSLPTSISKQNLVKCMIHVLIFKKPRNKALMMTENTV